MNMNSIKDLEKYQKNYSESGLLQKLSKFAGKMGKEVVYHILTLYYALQDPNLSKADRMLIYGALGYLILPADLIPDLTPLLGFTDDAAALMVVIKKIKISEETKAKAREKLGEWFDKEKENEIEETDK